MRLGVCSCLCVCVCFTLFLITPSPILIGFLFSSKMIKRKNYRNPKVEKEERLNVQDVEPEHVDFLL